MIDSLVRSPLDITDIKEITYVADAVLPEQLQLVRVASMTSVLPKYSQLQGVVVTVPPPPEINFLKVRTLKDDFVLLPPQQRLPLQPLLRRPRPL